MAITDRQAAAIRRRKQDKETDRRMADERSRMGLLGLDDGPERNPDVVGWFQPAGWTLKGVNHLCLVCEPSQPVGFKAVMKNLLAARMPCTRCGTCLETQVRPVVTGGEKKD